MPETMLAIVITAPGGPEALQPVRLPVPQPGPGEVLIRVTAAGVNYPDVAQRRGHYDPPSWHSPIPGLEASGRIAALGEGVSGFAPGDAVIALCNGGGYAEYVAVPAGQMLRLPEGVDFAEGAALPETWFTITQTLVMRAGLQPGMSVLIHGAAGGIGGAAIQISRALGARPIAVVSSPEKADYAKALGAEAVINHTEQDFVEAIMGLTGRQGADRIVNIAGGDMIAKNIRAAAMGATIIQLAGLGGDHAEIEIGRLLGKDITLIGSTLRKQPSATKAAIAATLRETLWPKLASGTIRLPHPAIFALEDAAAAHRAMEERSNFGKLVLVAPTSR